MEFFRRIEPKIKMPPARTEFRYVNRCRFSRKIKAGCCDTHAFDLVVIQPFKTFSENDLLPAFLFIPDAYQSQGCSTMHEQTASLIAAASGQTAIMLSLPAQTERDIPIFELFAALKWVSQNSVELGIKGDNIALVGFQLGANLAVVLSQMALSDQFSKISLQILVDPQFYISGSYRTTRPHRPWTKNHDRSKNCEKWLDIAALFNLPFDATIEELSGIPPTLVQLSPNVRQHCELDYYCTKLLHAGTQVTCVNYDEPDESVMDNAYSFFTKKLISQAAEELRKFG